MSSPAVTASVQIRPASAADVAPCAQICYNAFHAISSEHNFPCDFPSPSAAVQLFGMLVAHPGLYCVVAERDGRVVGSNCLDERSAIAGVGPITVQPDAQNHGVGRALMEAVLNRARERGFAGVRLLQAAYHNRSLSLYTKLGFSSREPISVMQGPAIKRAIEGCVIRPAAVTDLEAINEVCERVHGHNRAGEMRDSIEQGTAVVVERQGRVTGYASLLGFFGHAAAESNLDLKALIAAADGFAGSGILVPTRNMDLFSWCLNSGLRVVYPMTLMTIGLYNEPAGAYLPSILY